ncbi:MAG: hypothetical protein HXX09_16480 [Bacteroidetes bacterium]|nr:hypothetical protein [Bacteroidota bacterium]
MKLPWFRRIGIFFIPTTAVGWLIASCSVVFAIKTFINIDSKSHSVSDTLMNFVFNLLIICAVYSLIGFLASQTPKK